VVLLLGEKSDRGCLVAMSMQNVITQSEFMVGLVKIKTAIGVYVWKVKEICLVGD
jgi:hypothetical protein